MARRTQRVLGKEIRNPRRLLMLLSMWLELPGFSYLPLQLLYYDYQGEFAFPATAALQVHYHTSSLDTIMNLQRYASFHYILLSSLPNLAS